ncbi:hypothetical protein AAF712_013143 [Marasmius tenuissimus]|uniref:Uncharacterized protein n=1 Tax=Marasmius tenuissimus TaxID=585030 RepID=A0ABR2ZFP2_9AGAR
MIDRRYLSNDYIQDLHPSKYKQELDLYNRLLKHSPPLWEFLETLHEMKDYDGVEDAGKMLQRIASQAKSSDTYKVLTSIIGYIPRTLSDNDRLKPPIDAKNKDLQGLNHPDIAALLAPRDLHKHLFLPHTDKRYKHTVAKMMKKGKKKIIWYLLHLLKFLYGRYVPGDSFAGLFTSDIMFCTGRSISTTPSSALRREDWESAKGNNTQMKIHYVTARMICYVAYHIRHALIVSDTWDQDNKFNYAEFFHCTHTLLTRSFFDLQDYLDAVSKEVPRLENKKDLMKNELLEHHEKVSELIIETNKVRHAAWQQDVFCQWNIQASPDGEDNNNNLYYDPDGTPHRRPRKDGTNNSGECTCKQAHTANDSNTDA